MNFNAKKIEKVLRIRLKDKHLLSESLTHKSANKEKNNEKLEFLGDRVLGLALSKKLLDLYPNENEGIIDKRFAKLVNKKTCALVAWNSGLKDFIILGDSKKKITIKDEKILSDACEAVIGAIYIDRGFDYAKEFVLRLWKNNISESNVTILDSKTQLQEYSLKINKKLPIYKLLNVKGPKHNPTFKISVSIEGSKQYVGLGNSKQKAEQNAANNLLKSININ